MGEAVPAGRHDQVGRRLLPGLSFAAFPGVVLVLVLLLGLLGINGSSLSLYATNLGVDPNEAGVLEGPARPIRSDEWYVRTPWVLRQETLGLPGRARGGVGTHDVAVLSDLPTSGWETALRPHTAVYRVLGADQAFSVEWWSYLGIQLVGVYVLMLALTRRPALSTGTALLLGLSPATQWWYSPGTFTTIGYGCATGGLALAGIRSRGVLRAIIAVVGALCFAAFLTTLYVPWQVGTALVVVPVLVGALIAELRDEERRRETVVSIATVGGLVGAVGGILFVMFFLHHRATIDAIVGTVYPGTQPGRRGGGVNLVTFWGSPFDTFSAASGSGVVNASNQSENAAGLVLMWPVAVAAFGAASAQRLRRSALWFPFVGILISGAVLSAWMLLPIPAGLGLALLTRAAPQRLHLPLALASVVGLGLFAAYRREAQVQVTPVVLGVSVSAFAVTSAWAAGHFTVDGTTPSLRASAVLIVVVSVALALALSSRAIVGVGLLVLFVAWQAASINPLQRGTAPLTASPLRQAVDRIQDAEPRRAAWATFDVDPIVKGTLTASGVDHLTGVSPYPDAVAWRLLDPRGTNEAVWNRYAHVSLSVAPPGSPPAFELLGPDNLKVTVDPCGAELRRLEVEYFVSMEGGPQIPCTEPVTAVVHGGGRVLIQRRVSSRG